jgi:Tat protein secretion system quality control protein TatD with DNase activity
MYKIENETINVEIVAKDDKHLTYLIYLLDKNGLLIETDTHYDYKPFSDGEISNYGSKARE